MDKLKGTVGKLGAAFGIAFGVNEVINFGKELFNLAAKAEGVRKAFERIAPTGLLSSLIWVTSSFMSFPFSRIVAMSMLMLLTFSN